MFQQTATARIAAVFAAATVTTVLVASQFGLAQRYAGEADAQLARQARQAPLAQASAAAAAQRAPA